MHQFGDVAPVAFSPVLFEVVVDGQAYDEMHVDCGVVSQTRASAWLRVADGARRLLPG
jgi:hypothetical protein